MGAMSWMHWAIVAVVVLLLFGGRGKLSGLVGTIAGLGELVGLAREQQQGRTDGRAAAPPPRTTPPAPPRPPRAGSVPRT